MSEIQNKIWLLISIAPPTSVAKPSTPSVGRWFAVFFNQPLNTGIRGGYCAHMCADRKAGAEERPAGLSGTCLPPHVPLKDTETIGVR